MITTIGERPKRRAALVAQQNVITPLAKKRSAAMARKDRKNSRVQEEEQDEENQEEEEDEDDQSSSEEEQDLDTTGDFGNPASRKKRKANTTKKVTATKATKLKKGGNGRNDGSTIARQTDGNNKAPAKKKKAATKQGNVQRRKAVASKEDLPIKEDNKIFNEIRSSESDLAVTAEDWVLYYQDNSGMALAQMINFLFRASACNETIDENQAEDHDAIVGNLSDIQVACKQHTMPSYPIISRAPTYRTFRKAIGSFVENLFTSAMEADIVCDGVLMESLIAWISAMSSSTFRSFRHTATFVALSTIRQLSRLRQETENSLRTAIKNRDVERKKARGNKSRLHDLEKKVEEARQTKKTLQEHHSELINAVFVHRYRDSDASIRTECIEELGGWMKAYPEQYQESIYFQCVALLLSDLSNEARIAAVKAVNGLVLPNTISNQVKHFLRMHKRRLVDLAIADVDTNVRTSAIGVLKHVDRLKMLEDEQRDTLATHIFNIDPRIRAAVAGFVVGMLKEDFEEEDHQDEEAMPKIRLKIFAALLIRLQGQLDEGTTPSTLVDKKGDEIAIVGDKADSRIRLAVSALWDHIEALQDWHGIVDLLLFDHSGRGSAEEETKVKHKAGSRSTSSLPSSSPPMEEFRLDQEEEAALVEALIVTVSKTKAVSDAAAFTSAKDGDESEVVKVAATMTRDLIPALPKLFAKYRTEAPRISDVLLIPRLMNLDMYLETQQLGAYATLWDDVSDQYLRHVEPVLLNNAVNALVSMSQISALSTINAVKMNSLQERLVGSLREIVEGNELDTVSLDENQIHRLSASTLRLKLLARMQDMCKALEEDDKGAQTSGWDVLFGMAMRGKQEIVKESEMVENALSVLSLFVMWKTRSAVFAEENEGRGEMIGKLTEQSKALIDLADSLMRSMVEGVQRQAFTSLLDLHIMYATMRTTEATEQVDGGSIRKPRLPAELHISCSEELQEQCAEYICDEIDKFQKLVGADRIKDSTDASSGGGMKPKNKDGQGDGDPDTSAGRPSQDFLERQHMFVKLLSLYIGAIRLGVIDTKYSSDVLAFYGRLGHIFDACAKVLVDVLRDEGIYARKAQEVCHLVLQTLEQAHLIHTWNSSSNASELTFVNLSRTLSSALVVRGPHLAVSKAIDGGALVRMHARAMEKILERVVDDDESARGRSVSKAQHVTMFKALSNLLVSAGPREAMTIKASLDSGVKRMALGGEIGSKVWEPLRSYEKRLVTIASKSSKLAAGAAQNAGARPADERSGSRPRTVSKKHGRDEDDEGDGDGDGDGEDSIQERSGRDGLKGNALGRGFDVDETLDDLELNLTVGGNTMKTEMDEERMKSPGEHVEDDEESDDGSEGASSSAASQASLSALPGGKRRKHI